MPRTDSRVTGAVMAAAATVVLVTVGLLALSRAGGSTGPAAADTPPGAPATTAPASPTPTAMPTVPTPTPTVPTSGSGWRTESYRDLEIEVPSSWGYGSVEVWCVDASEPGPEVVDRPVDIEFTVLCDDPGSGYGVMFLDAGTTNFDPAYEPGVLVRTVGAPGEETGRLDNPIGSWVGYRSDAAGEVLVLVAARDRSIARRVLDSARTLVDADSNGCAIRRDGAAPAVERRTVAVCSYGEDGGLTQSELITGKAAAAVSAAVDATPVDDRPVGCAARPLRLRVALLREPDREVQVAYESDCRRARGVLIGDERRRLTAEVLYWATSPGNVRGWTDDVPMPDERR